jgi:hypothetical protein
MTTIGSVMPMWAVADSPDGPWRRFDKPIVDVSPDPQAPDALMTSNPAVTARPGGGVLLIYKAVGKKRSMPFGGPVVHMVARSGTGVSTYRFRFATPRRRLAARRPNPPGPGGFIYPP